MLGAKACGKNYRPRRAQCLSRARAPSPPTRSICSAPTARDWCYRWCRLPPMPATRNRYSAPPPGVGPGPRPGSCCPPMICTTRSVPSQPRNPRAATLQVRATKPLPPQSSIPRHLRKTCHESFDHPGCGASRCRPGRVVAVDQSGDPIREGRVVPPRPGRGRQGPRTGRDHPADRPAVSGVATNCDDADSVPRDHYPRQRQPRYSAVAYFRVVDAVKSVIAIENVNAAIDQIAQTTLRKVVGQHTLDETLSETDIINANIQQILDVATLEWGVEVTLVELKDIQLPDSMKRAMARQAEAEREKRAKIIAAEGESMAAAALGEASDTMIAHPLALQLRNLQTLAELGVEKNTTVVFPAPMMSAIGELGTFLARESVAAAPPQPVTTANGADTSTQPGPPPANGLVAGLDIKAAGTP